MSDVSKKLPYQPLGDELKRMREKRQESLAEVSGAVEIEVDMLTAIETGTERPSEDILLLLISYFGVKEEIASELWDLADYDQSKLPSEESPVTPSSMNTEKQPVIVIPMDARIVYTDTVHVIVNNHGVVMNFMQSSGTDNQPMAVARVGMSREHAKSVLELLQKTLAQSEPKALPPGATSSNN